MTRTIDVKELGGTNHRDKCGNVPEKEPWENQEFLSVNADYGYSNLLSDIEAWRTSPYVERIESIGTSVQGRDLWELMITDPAPTAEPRHTIYIHAWTHPHETQSWWVCEEIINYLLSEEPYAQLLREQCIFYVLPMYNPDGVELGTTRYNANGIDLEREWDKVNPQPEAAALKRRFGELMNSPLPIKIALNLHSSSDSARYFWFHDETGTSSEFAQLERKFVSGVRSWFGQIKPWNYRVSWINSTPTHFPESWFWLNYGTEVMALTFEDVFAHNLSTPDAYFDSSAFALLRGVGEYLDLQPSSIRATSKGQLTLRSFASRHHPLIHSNYVLPQPTFVRITLHNILGEEVAQLLNQHQEAGAYSFDWKRHSLPSGAYFVRLTTDSDAVTQKIIIEE